MATIYLKSHHIESIFHINTSNNTEKLNSGLDEEIVEEKMSELEAIHIIQMHERARQGRLR